MVWYKGVRHTKIGWGENGKEHTRQQWLPRSRKGLGSARYCSLFTNRYRKYRYGFISLEKNLTCAAEGGQIEQEAWMCLEAQETQTYFRHIINPLFHDSQIIDSISWEYFHSTETPTVTQTRLCIFLQRNSNELLLNGSRF